MRALAALAFGMGFVYALVLMERAAVMRLVLDPGKAIGPPVGSYRLISVDGRGVRVPYTASVATTEEWDA
jgi:hypothetical protein